MTVKTGNYLTKEGVVKTIKVFQSTGYQILNGNYIDKKYQQENEVIKYEDLRREYKNDIGDLSRWDIMYYRIVSSESTSIIQFLDSGLEIICGIETISEGGNKFE